MNTSTEVLEPAETPEGTDRYITILENIRASLEPSIAPDLPLKPEQAIALHQMYGGLISLNELSEHERTLSEHAQGFLQILRDIIASKPGCLSQPTQDADASENRELYIQLLQEWQIHFREIELRWDSDAKHAGPGLTALLHLGSMLFSEMGLVARLDFLQIVPTEEEKERLFTALDALNKEKK